MVSRQLGSNGPTVSELRPACMGLSFGLEPATGKGDGIAVIRGAFDRSMTSFDTAEAFRDSAAVIEASDLDPTALAPGRFTQDASINDRLTQKNGPFNGRDVSLDSLSDLIAQLAHSPTLHARQSLGVGHRSEINDLKRNEEWKSDNSERAAWKSRPSASDAWA